MQTHHPFPESDRLLDLHAVEDLVSVKKTWIYEAMLKGEFPRPRKLSQSGRARRWVYREVHAWILARQVT